MKLRFLILAILTLANAPHIMGKSKDHLKEQITFDGNAGTWSPDGNKFAVVSYDKKPYQTTIYNAKTWEKLKTFQGALKEFSTDSSKIITVCVNEKIENCTINVSNLKTGQKLQSFKGANAQFIAKSNNILVTYGPDMTIYDLTDGHELKNFKRFYATISPDGTKVVSRVTCTYSAVCDLADVEKAILSCCSTQSVFSQDSSMIAFSLHDDKADQEKQYETVLYSTEPQYKTVLYGTSDGKQLGEFRGICANCSAKMLATVIVENGKCKTILYDLATNQQRDAIPGDLQFFSPDGSKALLFNTETRKAEIYTITPKAKLLCTALGDYAYFSPDGSKIASSCESKVKVFELR